MSNAPGSRQRDQRADLNAFWLEVLVECPTCEACAVVRPHPQIDAAEATWHDRTFTPRRLVCGACGLVREWPLEGSSPTVDVARDGRDPWFGLPLWLSAPCCGSVLWAYNTDHLDVIAAWVGAQHRERGSTATPSGDPAAEHAPSTMLERLPAWITAAKHRDEVLKTTTRLRATAPMAP